MTFELKEKDNEPFQYWSTELKWSTNTTLMLLEKSSQFNKLQCITPKCEHLVNYWIDDYCLSCTKNHIAKARKLRIGKNPFDLIEEDPFQEHQKSCFDCFKLTSKK
jgi:hypothetical protein